MVRSYLLIPAILFAGLAVWISPDRLSALGLMDRSLASPNPLVRETALLEVRVARILAAVLAFACFLAWAAFPRLLGSRWMRAILRTDFRFPAAYERQQARVFSGVALVAYAGLVLAVVYLVFGDRIFSEATLWTLNEEDGVLETLSALLLLVAAVLSLSVAYRAGVSATGLMHGGLGVLFFLMCGEEISWGQRYLQIETPEVLHGINVQSELNFHNMFGYLFDHLFILCFFVWGCVIPVLYWTAPVFRGLLVRLGVPFPSIGLGIAMFLVTLMQEQVTDALFGSLHTLRVAELREFLSALCFVLLMIESRKLVEGQVRAAGKQRLSARRKLTSD